MAWETKTVTPKEYYLLASQQFPSRGSFLPPWQVANTQTFYRQGLIVTAFISKQSAHCVIAFHVFGDAAITHETMEHAHEFVKTAKEQARRLNYPVSYTGKHVGGAVAELCAMNDKLPAYTFDSASIYKDYSSLKIYA